MMPQMVELILIAHASGFVIGGFLVYLLMTHFKRILLGIPNIPLTKEFIEYYKRDLEIQKLNHVVKDNLDKLAHSGG